MRRINVARQGRNRKTGCRLSRISDAVLRRLDKQKSSSINWWSSNIRENQNQQKSWLPVCMSASVYAADEHHRHYDCHQNIESEIDLKHMGPFPAFQK